MQSTTIAVATDDEVDNEVMEDIKMAKSNPAARRGYSITKGTGRTADDYVSALKLDDATPAKAGDALPIDERRREIPPQRVRAAGMTGAEFPAARTTGENVTDDDLAPETLFNQRDSSAWPNDQSLEIVGLKDIGAGFGLDEAELALKEHPDTDYDHAADTKPGKKRR